MVVIEKIDGGGYRVSRVLPCAASMQVAAVALEAVNPAAYQPAAVEIAHADGHTADGAGIVPHEIAAAALRDRALVTDEDAGAPGEPPRCKANGACD